MVDVWAAATVGMVSAATSNPTSDLRMQTSSL